MKRNRLPPTRESVTHRVMIGKCKLFFTIGLYPDGSPGELFIVIDKEGSELAGAYDAFGIAVSMLLQSGWTVEELAKKFAHSRSEPDGLTDSEDKELKFAKSIPDYIFRWMILHLSLPTAEDTPGNTDSEEREVPE